MKNEEENSENKRKEHQRSEQFYLQRSRLSEV